MRRWAALLALWVVIAAAAAALLVAAERPAPAPDVPAANDLVQTTLAHWPTPRRGDYPTATPDFTVVDARGGVVLAEGMPVRDDASALRARASAFALVHGGTRVGTLYLVDPYPARLAVDRHRLVVVAVTALVLVGLAVTLWFTWLDRRVLAPFRELRSFADKVARGDLDAPLAVRKGDAFGAFTESFDILRTELARSREREAASQQARKVLVAQLSHDIRTPLASIRATTELIQLGDDDPRLQVVTDKALQIERLTDDLLAANADDLEDVPIVLTVRPSTAIGDLVREADDAGWLTTCDVPEIMVVADPDRLRQVVDNVVANAGKYAGPPLELRGRLEDDLLVVALRDHGEGIPADELPLVTRRHYRAANAAGLPGQGLGLHTAYTLMERMGGDLTIANATDGSGCVVTLTLACAERAHDPRSGAVRII